MNASLAMAALWVICATTPVPRKPVISPMRTVSTEVTDRLTFSPFHASMVPEELWPANSTEVTGGRDVYNARLSITISVINRSFVNELRQVR